MRPLLRGQSNGHNTLSKGLSIKYVRNQERGGLFSADNGGGGSSDAVVWTFWYKNYRFFEIYSVSAQTRGEGVEPVRTFCGQGRSIFREFVQASFMDVP